MKIINKHQSKQVISGQAGKRPYRIFTALVLSGIVSLGGSLTMLEAASAGVGEGSHSDSAELLKRKDDKGDRGNRGNRGDRDAGDDRDEIGDGEVRDVRADRDDTEVRGSSQQRQQNSRANRFPPNLASAVRRDLSRQTRIAVGKLRVTNYSRQTWPNGCLGLPRPDEVCTQALVEGWRVVLSNGSQTWVYRTDTSGRILRLENGSTSVNSPQSIEAAVLQDAARRSGLSISALRIVQTQRRNWSDGCLGLGGPVDLCLNAIVPGWRVVVASGQQRWVYRTNQSGSVVKLDEAASQISDADDTLKPTQIQASELPPPLPVNVVLRAIASGGITGDTYETIVTNDGRVIRTLVTPRNGTASEPQTYTISRQQLRQLQQELQQLSQFNQLNYPAPSGAADYITVTLTSRFGTTRYADIVQNRLPERLQAVVQAWNQVASRAQ